MLKKNYSTVHLRNRLRQKQGAQMGENKETIPKNDWLDQITYSEIHKELVTTDFK